jgi:type VI secretion system secreted protein Hcp
VNFVKRIDRSTPLLLKALVRNERVDEAEFRFFRPDTETGEEVHFYTVRLENGKITGVEQSSEDSTLVGDDAPPMLEEVAIVFHTITWTYEPTGATHTDSLTA